MRPIVLILGPTAGGKTTLSIELAHALDGGGECICADSMQVYRGMDIGTAKPTKEEQEAAPHHLLDFVDPSEDGFTVDTWLKLAQMAIEDVRERNRWPILVGGTNLYVQALLFGLFDGPACDVEKRTALDGLTNTQLHTKLCALDPESSTRIHINDRRRMIRAIEVSEEVGTPLSTLQSQWSTSAPREDIKIIGLAWHVETINARINTRVKLMMEQGFLEEVASLHGKLGKQASEAIGYKQLLAYLEGEITLDEAIEQIKILTRRYGKQQRSWLRRFKVLPSSHFIDMPLDDPQRVIIKALTHIEG